MKKKTSAPKAPSMKSEMPTYAVGKNGMSADEKKREEQYRLDDDSRTIRNYLELHRDGERHGRAVQHMRDQNDGLDELEGRHKEAMPRKTRKLGRKFNRSGARR